MAWLWRVGLLGLLLTGGLWALLSSGGRDDVQAQILLTATPGASPRTTQVRDLHDIPADEKVRRANTAPAEVALWAQEHVRSLVGVASGTPEIVLNRRVLASELPTLGVPFGGRRDGEPPLSLVILRGDFDLNQGLVGFRGNAPATEARGRYVALIYDMWAQLPIGVWVSPRGGLFRKALNDASLPADDPVRAWPTARPGPGALTEFVPMVPPGATPVSGDRGGPMPPTPTPAPLPSNRR